MAGPPTPDVIYHITPRTEWSYALATGSYRPDSLHDEGFIHCSTLDQVVRVADFLYPGTHGLVLLEVIVEKVSADINFDEVAGGERFPHVYGPINCDAVARVLPFEPEPTGNFRLPSEIVATGSGQAAGIAIDRIDHVVLTVKDVAATSDFYASVLGMRVETTPEGRTSLRFGFQKINLHQAGAEIEPHAANPVPGSADICLLTAQPIADVLAHLAAQKVAVVLGPVRRAGATGPMDSVYFRDPDGNLIEVSRLA